MGCEDTVADTTEIVVGLDVFLECLTAVTNKMWSADS